MSLMLQELPNSYKIQVLYQDVPSFVKTRPVDSPFRFATYEDAITVGKEMFNDVKYRIVGSSDRPHWQSGVIEKALPETLSKKVWYDLYGVTGNSKVVAVKPRMWSQEAQAAQRAQGLQPKQSVQLTQGPQKKQLTQSTQGPQKKQLTQSAQVSQNKQSTQSAQVSQNKQSTELLNKLKPQVVTAGVRKN
jgi:hypothetical protein